MKYRIFFLLLFSVLISSAQTGTIKIVKPPVVKKDSVVKTPPPRYMMIGAGANYTFKKNTKYGFNAEIIFILRGIGHGLNIGIQYSQEYRYLNLSAYDKISQLPTIGYVKTQNKLEFIKLPIQAACTINIGVNKSFTYSLGIAPEYLVNSKNEFNRLTNKDYNRFNVAGCFGIRFRLFRNFALGVKYSKELFQQLKDINVYDISGNSIGKQNSRTDLLSASLIYYFAIKRL